MRLMIGICGKAVWNERKNMAKETYRPRRLRLYANEKACSRRAKKLESNYLSRMWPGVLGNTIVAASQRTGCNCSLHGVRYKEGNA